MKKLNKNQRKPSKIKKLAVAAIAATVVAFSPLKENIAHAQDATVPDPVEQTEPRPAEPAPRAEEPTEEEPQERTDVEPAADLHLQLRPHIDAADAEAEIDYSDRELSPFSTEVNISGRRRSISLDNAWDLGGNVYANEAGSAVFGTVMYSLRGSGSTPRPLDIRFDGGNIWFGPQAAPFARLMIRPSVNFWRFKLAYYGSVAALGNMPSVLYTSHSVGFGYSQPLGENARLRLGAVIGGALSYPKWDDIYLNLATGLSLEIHNFMIYGMPNFYFAAPDPIKTAYFGHYRPEFQNIEFGAQYRFLEDQYTARLFGEYGRINQRVGARITRTINFSDTVEGDVYVGGGATHWSEFLGGRWDPMVMVGLNIVFGGESFNSTNTFTYEHLQAGDIEFAETDFPTAENPGVYGFGRSGNPEIDAQVNLAKSRIRSAGSIQEFSTLYDGAPVNEVITTARFMGAFMQQVAYANGVQDALNNTDFLNPDVERISNATMSHMFGYLQRYTEFYSTHSSGTPLPEDLRNGVAVCAGIHHLMAEFMRANGVPTIVASINTPNGPHVVAIGMPDGETDLLDYGNLYRGPGDALDQTMRFYGRNRGAPTFQSQLFDENGYAGTYITSEGRLLHNAVGIDNRLILGLEFLGVR